MSYLLDTSLIVPLVVDETFTHAATRWIAAQPMQLHIGRLATAEAASALSRLRRMGTLDAAAYETALEELDRWFADSLCVHEHHPEDIARAARLVRRPTPKLLTVDAVHLATAERLEFVLVTFDRGMAEVAKARGIAHLVPEL